MLGDTVEQIIKRLIGEQNCSKCKKRKAMLNKIDNAIRVKFTIKKK